MSDSKNISFKALRSFIPVGQGAFYCEDFIFNDEKIHVVYDCGSENFKILKNRIKSTFDKEPIDALFISHFHDDHVNGIPMLYGMYGIKKIFFPYLTESEKICIYLSELIKNKFADSFICKFLENPKTVFNNIQKDSPELICVKAYNSKEELSFNDNIEVVSSGDYVEKKIFGEKGIDWNFVPYNYRQDEKAVELTDELKKSLQISDVSIDILKSKFLECEDDKEKIITVYNKLFKTGVKINFTTMLLFSYSSNAKYLSVCKYKNSDTILKLPSGCFYMGDFDIKDDDFFAKMKIEKDYIGCIQIPHHGSKNVPFDNFFSNGKTYIISVGNDNSHNHPSLSMMKRLFLEYSGIRLFIVTENIESSVFFTISTDNNNLVYDVLERN